MIWKSGVGDTVVVDVADAADNTLLYTILLLL